MADFSGVTFAKQNVTPADDGLIRRALLSDGILNLSVAFSLVKIVKHQQPDVIDVEYYE